MSLKVKFVLWFLAVVAIAWLIGYAMLNAQTLDGPINKNEPSFLDQKIRRAVNWSRMRTDSLSTLIDSVYRGMTLIQGDCDTVLAGVFGGYMQTVTFPVAYNAIPFVCVTAQSLPNNCAITDFELLIREVTTTSFKVVLNTGYCSSGDSTAYNWIAVGR